MVNGSCGARLSAKPFYRDLVGRKMGMKDFYRDSVIYENVSRAVDLSHTAFADLFVYAVFVIQNETDELVALANRD